MELSRHARETDTIFVFNETNSTLRGWIDDDPNYQVISGLGRYSRDIWDMVKHHCIISNWYDDWIPKQLPWV